MIQFFILFSLAFLNLATCPMNSYTCTISSVTCTACNSNRFLIDSKICADSCPSRFTASSNLCTSSNTNCAAPASSSSAVVLRLQFKPIQDLTLTSIATTSDSSELFENPGGISYNSQTQNSPLPTLDRGFYFATTSSITSNKSHIPSLYFMLKLWIKPLSYGQILVVSYNSKNYISCYISNPDLPKFEIIVQSSTGSGETLITAVSSTSSSQNWQNMTFRINQTSCSSLTVVIYMNSSAVVTTTFSSVEASFPNSNSYTWTVGKGGGNDSFRGFLAVLEVRCDSQTSYSSSPITIECYDNQFWNGSSCQNCPAICSTWPWCITSTTCSVCSVVDCSSCQAYSSFTCLGCSTGVLPNCCDILASACTQTWSNTACQTGYFLIGGVCLYACPYGFGNCVSVSSAVITADFMTTFAGSYGALITATSPSSYNFWNSPEGSDPIPAKNRGLYFNGSAFLSGSINLSHTWSMGMWVYVVSGAIIGHSTGRLSLSSDGTLSFDLQMWDATYASYSASQTIIPSTWAYASYSVGFSSKASTITPYLNNVAGTATSVTNYVFRLQSGGTLYIGKDGTHYFTGFISYFQLWGVTITSFSTAYNLYGFSGGIANTLWPCSIDQYYNGTACESCLGTCSSGCARANSCNICVNDLCTKCNYFTTGTCYECVAHASGATCACDSDSLLSADGCSCDPCSTGCSQCTETTYQKCTACYSGFFSFSATGQCLSECPSGYNANSSTNNCDYFSNLALSLDLTDQIRLDTVSGFNVGSKNTNVYPDWSDIYDPIPAYKRGYYFNQTSYLSSSAMIAPSFTISVWIKSYSSGILLTKYTSTDILKITINSSGYIALSIIFSDSSPESLSTTINILNHWTFLSFTGQVQSDGKTKLTIYRNAVNSDSFTTVSLIYFKDTLSGTLYVGSDENFGSNGLYGFLDRLKIYNSYFYQSDDYATSCTGCSACPSNNQCWSGCGLNDYPDSCSACLSVCNQGCVSDLTCRLCRDNECYSCTTFSGECTSCITNAYKLAGHCKCLSNAIWISSSQSCELCSSACSTCSALEYTGCLICISGNYLIQSLCITFCPTGYIINGSKCDSDTDFTNSFVFNLKPHQIKDIILDSESKIPVLTGKDNSFYPTYDVTDPIAAIYRGYYFSGSAYMQLPPYAGTISPLLTFAPKFVISTWVMPISATGALFCKQTDSGLFTKYMSFELINQFPSLTLTLKDSSTITYTSSISSLKVDLSQWNFISAVSSISATPQQIIILTTNTYTDTSSNLRASWLNDLQSSFFLTIGACHLDSLALNSFYFGFLWDLKVYNAPISSSLTLSSCNGCSLCPIDNSNACLDSCLINSFWDGSSCSLCLPACFSHGCVRGDKNCNLCQDVICEICDDYTGTCMTCKTNAALVGSNCQCNEGYYWNSNNEECDLCDTSCKTCTSSTYLDCLTCVDGLDMASRICMASCPLGYSKSSSGCVLTKVKIFDLDLNTLEGVVCDKASSIPAVTGSTKQFYPDYEADDPIPAYLRGFWFNGLSSILRLPEYSSYTSPRLVISSPFTISIWLNTETPSASILSKHIISDNYQSFYSISLIDSKPEISLTIGSSQFLHISQSSLKYYEWSHAMFTFETSQSGYNTLSSYLDGLSDSSTTTEYGAFIDIGPLTTIVIGALMSSSTAYNFYQGFIYSIQIFNTIVSLSSLSSKSCTDSCSVCPTSQICIPNCRIYEYWNGPSYNVCNLCSTSCTRSCRNKQSTCSLCDNLLCDACTDYSASGCGSCKENAINPESCICGENYVLDTSSNSTCIPLPPGGFRGTDGTFYSCPNLCTICQSLTSCTACVENASLINGLCYCNLGYNGTIACTFIPFSAKLTVLSDNSLYLNFSDSLANSFAKNDVTITIEKQGEVSFKIEQVNSTCYYITLVMNDKISKGALVALKLLNLTQFRSVSNGILSSSELSGYLNYYDPTPYSPSVAAAASQAATGVQASISIAAILSFINPSPSSLWSIMNYLQILSYLTLSGIPISTKMSTFLNNLNSFNLFPNIFPYFIDENEGNTPYYKAEDFGYNSDLILITTGSDFTLILFSLSALPAAFFFSRCSHRWIGKKFMKALKNYRFSFYLRFWIQCYLELGAAASIGIVTLGFSNLTQMINIILCIFIYILLSITPPWLLWFSYKSKNRIQSREKSFIALFDSLFYEFRTDGEFLATQYYFLFFSRRLIYIVNLVYLREFPQTEVTINIVLSLMTIMYLWFFWPYEDPILQVSNLLTEILIFLVMGATSVYLFNFEQKIVSAIETSIVAIVIAIIAVQSIVSIVIFIRTLFEFAKQKLSTKENINNIRPPWIHFKKPNHSQE
ncbi:unnamed protein product [Blepharisma stoltei]|uniref:EGF-like domain-containing protein n=1 Tax=Blepharisma stoltei TaxID=1481888 RepID=A0AAU9KA97_9CILI|nr:unnamed protein product [Blepharisma stoltei]